MAAEEQQPTAAEPQQQSPASEAKPEGKATKTPKTPKTPKDKDAGFAHATIARMMKEGQDARVSNEAVHVMGKATELFIQFLAAESCSVMGASKHKTIHYTHVAKVINNTNSDRLVWLSEIVPEKEPASKYMVKEVQ